MSSSRLDEKRIVEMLLAHRELTVPKLAELLGSSNSSVDYHLKNLVERQIVSVKKKKYGSLYSLSENRTSISSRTSAAFAASFVFLIAGLLFTASRVDLAIISLAISSIIGTVSAVSNATRERKEKVKILLELI